MKNTQVKTPFWKSPFTLDQMKTFTQDTMVAHLGITITEIGDTYLKGTMPVDHRTKQPYGILHGGASVTLAETLGSIASAMAAEQGKQCVGLEINANHIARVTEGYVTGIATPLHIGRSTHVWEIKMTDDAGKLTCISRLTVAIIEGK